MAAVASSSLLLSNPCSRPPLFLSSQPSIHSLCFKTSLKSQLSLLHLSAQTKGRSWTALKSSAAETPPSDPSERWLLEPIGDGDSRHIGYRVPLPNAFEIASNAVTVGRLPEKADMVIPVATVSGLHARLERRNGALLVTDLDSTNGTYIEDKKLRPGAVTPISPGSRIIFGDTHLAMFRISKVEVDIKENENEPKREIQQAAAVQVDNLETAS